MSKVCRKKMQEDENRIIQYLQTYKDRKIKEISELTGYSEQKIYRVRRKYNKRGSRTDLVVTNLGNDSNYESPARTFVLLIRQKDGLLNNKIKPKELIELQKRLINQHIVMNFSYLTHGFSEYAFCVSTENIQDIKLFRSILEDLFNESKHEVKIIEFLKPIGQSSISLNLNNGFKN